MSNLCHIRLLWESCFVKKWITLLCTLFFTIEFVRKEGHIKMRFTCPGSFSRIRRTLGAALTSSGALLWQTLSCCWKRKRLLLDVFGAFCCLLPPSDTSVNSNVLDLLRRWETALQRELGISGVMYRVGHIFPPDRNHQILVDLTMTPNTHFLYIFSEKSCFSIYDL